MVNAKAFLEKRYSEDMELEDAIHTALLTLKEGFEGETEPAGACVGVEGRVLRAEAAGWAGGSMDS
jgi:20S proteasome subunit alpha 2